MILSKLFRKSILVSFITALVVLLQLFITNELSEDKALLSHFVYIDFIVLASLSIAVFGGEQGFINILSENGGRVPFYNIVFSFVNYTVFVFPIFLFFTYFSLNYYNYFSLYFAGFFLFINQCFVFFFRYKHLFLLSSISERGVWLFFLIYYFIVDVGLFVTTLLSGVSILLFSVLASFCAIEDGIKNPFSRGKFNCEATKKNVYITGTSYLVLCYERLDQFLISIFISPIVLASYFVAQKLSFVTKFITRSVYQVLYSLLKSSRGLIQSALNLNSTLAFTFSVSMVFFGGDVLEVFEVSPKQYHLTLILLSISVFISSLNNTLYQFVNHKGASNLYFKNSLVLVSLQALLVAPFMYFLSYEGIALSRIIVSLVGARRSYRDFCKVSGSEVVDPKLFISMLLVLFLLGGYSETFY